MTISDPIGVFILLWFSLIVIVFALGHLFMTEDARKMLSEAAAKGNFITKTNLLTYKIMPAEIYQIISIFGLIIFLVAVYVLLFSRFIFPFNHTLLLIALLISLILESLLIQFIILLKSKHVKSLEASSFFRTYWVVMLSCTPKAYYQVLIIIYSAIYIVVIYKIMAN